MACNDEIRKLKKDMERLRKEFRVFTPEQIDKRIEKLIKIEDAEKQMKAINDVLKPDFDR